MPATYEPIATTTLGSAASTITFSSISGSFTDLRLVITALQGTGTNIGLRFNSDSGTNYSRTLIRGSGTAVFSERSQSDTEIDLNREGLSTTIPSFYAIDIFSYASSTNKTLLTETSEDRNGSGAVVRAVGLWRNTAAITSITITTLSADTFATGTTATLYGILKA